MERFQAQLAAEQRHRILHGRVRPPRHTVAGEWRIVIVGSNPIRIPVSTTFHDFLFSHLRDVLNAAWLQAALRKRGGPRHPVAEWVESAGRQIAGQPGGADDVVEAPLTGVLKAYLAFAYDLFVVADNQQLLRYVVKRLRDPVSFQGARYELAVTATMLRAGFDIQHEDERDSSRSHPEFVARHIATGQELAVEAKSRHRHGVLGFRGGAGADRSSKLGIHGLLRDAVRKASHLPYVVFVDLNLPPAWNEQFDPTAVIAEFEQALRREDSPTGGTSGPTSTNLVVLTNFPDHYTDAVPPPPGIIHYAASVNPRRPVSHPSVLDEILVATERYGTVPLDWPAF